MNILQIKKGDAGYPSIMLQFLGNNAPKGARCNVPLHISAIGNSDILQHKKLAIFCSAKCPGNLILRTYDLAQKLRKERITVISGFHSPIEQECLRLLLRGDQPIIICLARSIERLRIRREYRKPLAKGRLLILSPFAENQHRPTVAMSLYRNHFVAALADRIFVPYAAPSSKTENFCNEILSWQKPLYTFESDFNQNLIFRGAQLLSLENFSAFS
jgi:predicted Rossmann fold nucleotide-binding protein DprA/Smf involved in DNA uptake